MKNIKQMDWKWIKLMQKFQFYESLSKFKVLHNNKHDLTESTGKSGHVL